MECTFPADCSRLTSSFFFLLLLSEKDMVGWWDRGKQESESQGGNQLTQVQLERWSVIRSVFVLYCISPYDIFVFGISQINSVMYE